MKLTMTSGLRKLELSLKGIIPPNSSLSQNRLMSQECKISDWRVNYTRAITEGDSSIQQGHRHKENDKKGLSSWTFYLIN